MERLTTQMQHRPAMYTFTIIICQTTDDIHYLLDQSRYQQLAITTLQIRRLLWDDVHGIRECIHSKNNRCSIY